MTKTYLVSVFIIKTLYFSLCRSAPASEHDAIAATPAAASPAFGGRKAPPSSLQKNEKYFSLLSNVNYKERGPKKQRNKHLIAPLGIFLSFGYLSAQNNFFFLPIHIQHSKESCSKICVVVDNIGSTFRYPTFVRFQICYNL